MSLIRILRKVKSWLRRPGSRAPVDWNAQVQRAIALLRSQGARIGDDCVIFTDQFSQDPYLVEIGNRVVISGGTLFLTHDGAASLLRRRGRPHAQHLGRIIVGDDTYIAQNCMILPGSTIGAHCIIGAGAVVRGTIPDNSVAVGNPAKVIGRTSLFLERMERSPDTIDSFHLPSDEREAMLRGHFQLNRREAS